MKKLLLTRHSEAGWGEEGTSDHERPLTDSGRLLCEQLSIQLKDEFDQVEKVFVSSARRAQETAQFLKINESKKEVSKAFYTFDARTLLGLISDLKIAHDYIQIIAHNPAITELINYKSDGFIPNVPPAGIVLLEWKEAETWSDIEDLEAKMIWFKKS